MSAPIDTIDAAIAAMDGEVDRCLDCGDAGGYFAIVYRAVTERVRDGITAGEFADGEQMERFDVLFARRYLDARASWRLRLRRRARIVAARVRNRRRPGGASSPSTCCSASTHTSISTSALPPRLRPPPGEVEALRDDFETINDVLAELVDRMQESLATVSPWTRWVDVAGLRFDEALVTFSLRRARADAWDFATALSAASAGRTSTSSKRSVTPRSPHSAPGSPGPGARCAGWSVRRNAASATISTR